MKKEANPKIEQPNNLIVNVPQLMVFKDLLPKNVYKIE